jgi:SP family arabinose:H+ symporter-like MFS transporter
VSGIALSMFILSYSFNAATYTLTDESIAKLPTDITVTHLAELKNKTFDTDTEFKEAVATKIGTTITTKYESELITASITMNSTLILFCILGFVASFAISLGPVMWVLFSELFPNRIRGVAISFVGFINSAVSFLVQLVFPWELANLGTTITFLLFGLFAFFGLLLIIKLLPETKGKSLEELEAILVK